MHSLVEHDVAGTHFPVLFAVLLPFAAMRVGIPLPLKYRQGHTGGGNVAARGSPRMSGGLSATNQLLQHSAAGKLRRRFHLCPDGWCAVKEFADRRIRRADKVIAAFHIVGSPPRYATLFYGRIRRQCADIVAAGERRARPGACNTAHARLRIFMQRAVYQRTRIIAIGQPAVSAVSDDTAHIDDRIFSLFPAALHRSEIGTAGNI